jgi:hypothetical protein
MDQGLKRLCQTRPQDLLAFALPGAEFVGPLQTDLATEPQLTTDTLFRARYHGEDCVVDLEAEAAPSAEMAERCFLYDSRTYWIHRLPVLSVVLWLQRGHGGTPPRPPWVLGVGDKTCGTWGFDGIELYAIPAERLLESGLVGLLPLVPFTEGGATEGAIERAARAVQERAPADQLAELEGLLAVFGARSLGADAIRALMRRVLMNTEILEQSPLYREWVAEATSKGMQQGMQQGRQDGARLAALAVWRARFGEPQADVVPALEGEHDAGRLNELVAALAVAGDRAAARALLGLGPEPGDTHGAE